MLLKEVEPTSGEVTVGNTELSKLTRKAVPYFRRKIGMVYQDFKLIPTLNIYENVAFAMKVVEASSKDIRRRVPMVLSLVGLSHKYKMFPNELSGGEQQRVAIARALAKDPDVFLCDEPTGALDSKSSKDVLRVLQYFCKEFSKTVIVITHNSAIAPMADKVIKFKSGKVEEIKINKKPVDIERIEW